MYVIWVRKPDGVKQVAQQPRDAQGESLSRKKLHSDGDTVFLLLFSSSFIISSVFTIFYPFLQMQGGKMYAEPLYIFIALNIE